MLRSSKPRTVHRLLQEGPAKSLARMTGNHQTVVIACMPKSGSTFFSKSLQKTTGFKPWHLVLGYGADNHQAIDFLQLLRGIRFDTITQQHMLPDPESLQILKLAGGRVIVQIRNLFDVVYSMEDHIRQQKETGKLDGGPLPPWRHPRHIPEDPARLRTHIVRFQLPWYVRFFARWKQAEEAGLLPLMWVRYEDMVEHQIETFAATHRFLELPDDPEAIKTALSEGPKGDIRFNKGKLGRGAALEADLKEEIVALTAFYPELDWTPSWVMMRAFDKLLTQVWKLGLPHIRSSLRADQRNH